MPLPQWPHRARPVSRVGPLVARTRARLGLRLARLCWTCSHSSPVMMAGTLWRAAAARPTARKRVRRNGEPKSAARPGADRYRGRRYPPRRGAIARRSASICPVRIHPSAGELAVFRMPSSGELLVRPRALVKTEIIRRHGRCSGSLYVGRAVGLTVGGGKAVLNARPLAFD